MNASPNTSSSVQGNQARLRAQSHQGNTGRNFRRIVANLEDSPSGAQLHTVPFPQHAPSVCSARPLQEGVTSLKMRILDSVGRNQRHGSITASLVDYVRESRNAESPSYSPAFRALFAYPCKTNSPSDRLTFPLLNAKPCHINHFHRNS